MVLVLVGVVTLAGIVVSIIPVMVRVRALKTHMERLKCHPLAAGISLGQSDAHRLSRSIPLLGGQLGPLAAAIQSMRSIGNPVAALGESARNVRETLADFIAVLR